MVGKEGQKRKDGMDVKEKGGRKSEKSSMPVEVTEVTG